MARIDYQRIAYEKAKKEAFEELQEFLKTNKGRKALPNWMGLLDYFADNESKINEMEETIKEYRQFFSKLKSFLPRDFSIHDKIG